MRSPHLPLTSVLSFHLSADSACGSKQIRSDTTIRVTLEVPAWLRFLSVGVIEKTGSKVGSRLIT